MKEEKYQVLETKSQESVENLSLKFYAPAKHFVPFYVKHVIWQLFLSVPVTNPRVPGEPGNVFSFPYTIA